MRFFTLLLWGLSLTFTTALMANQAPVAVCNATLNYALPYDDCEVNVSVNEINIGSYDADGDAIYMSLSQYVYGLGTHIVTLTVSDGSLTNSCWTEILVEDKNVPTVTCNNTNLYVADAETVDIDAVVLSLYNPSTSCNHANAYDVFSLSNGNYTYRAEVINWSTSETAACWGRVYIYDGEPQVYCTPSANTTYEFISEFSVSGPNNNIDRSSGNDGGYHYEPAFTDASLHNGSTYTLSYEPGFTYGPYHQYWRIYLDTNGDGDFTDAGELIHSWNGNGGNSTNYTVPGNARWGYTRMRVVMQYGSYGNSCTNGQYGETEDYSVIIKPNTWYPGFLASETAGAKDMIALERVNESAEPGESLRRRSLPGIEKRTVEVSIYPNPAVAGRPISVTAGDELSQLVLMNAIGRVVGSQSAEKGIQKTFALPTNLPAGTYLLRGNNATGKPVFTKRILVN